MAESFWSQLENTIGADRLKPSCSYDCQSARGYSQVVDIDSLRQNASIEDWKKYLLQGPELCTEMTRVQNTVNVGPRNSHGAYITFASTLDGGYTPIVKKKRNRTVFTTEQVSALEQVFYAKPYVTREERKALENQLKISDKAIKVWFQNRRLKEKKEKEEQEYCSSGNFVKSIKNTTSDPSLGYVESQIQNVDKYGFVTLDDRAIAELVTAIDDCLPKDLTVFEDINGENIQSESSVSKSECNVIYEPISPPDFTDAAREDIPFQNWIKFESIEPSKAFERLFDAHTL